MTFCGCGVAEDEDYFCRRCGRSLRVEEDIAELRDAAPGQSLCRTLRACSTRTFELMAQTYDGGRLVPGEDAFTHLNLLDLARLHGDRVAVHRFVGAEEALNGADWEWWFYAGDVGLGMRIQAKRASRTGRFDFRKKSGSGDRHQCDVLVEDAAEAGCVPAYVLYNHINWVADDPRGRILGCAHGPGEQSQMGCTMVSALSVQAMLRRDEHRPTQVKRMSVPWHRVLCDAPSNSLTGLEAAAARVRRMDDEGSADVRAADEYVRYRTMAEQAESAGGPTATRAGETPAEELGPHRIEEALASMPRSVRTRIGDLYEDALGEADRGFPGSPQEETDEFAGLVAPQLSRLPDRVLDVIAGRQVEPHDPRIGRVVAVDLG